MRQWRVIYERGSLVGVAFVRAKTEEEALRLFRKTDEVTTVRGVAEDTKFDEFRQYFPAEDVENGR